MSDKNSSRPRVACEVTAEHVVAARAGEGAQSLEAVNAQNLAPGSVTPGLQQANVVAREALVAALRDALAPVAGRSRDITLVIPDASSRILLLDFDTLPESQEDADSVVRFRLKKSLPFDVEASAVSFDRSPAEDGVRVVAAVTPRSVVEEYEAVVREAGYNPGAVLPSMIAALGVVDGARPTMVIKVEPGTTTFAIVDQNQLLLYRSLENGGTAVTGESLVDDVNTSLVYFEDRYGISVDRVLVTGVQSAQSIAGGVRQQQHPGGGVDLEQRGGRRRGQRGALGAGGSGGGAGFLMRININLASNPYEAAREYARRMTMLLGALVLVTVGLVGYILHQRGTTRDVDQQIAQTRQEIASLDAEKAQAQTILNQPQNRDVADQSAFLNNLFARKALSWTQVFAQMEKLMPANIHVVSMKPEFNRDNQLVLHVVVVTPSRDKAVELVKHMEDSPHFRSPRVESENAVGEGASGACRRKHPV